MYKKNKRDNIEHKKVMFGTKDWFKHKKIVHDDYFEDYENTLPDFKGQDEQRFDDEIKEDETLTKGMQIPYS